jgi:hypothetical protein
MMDTSGPQELHATGFVPVSSPTSRASPSPKGVLTASPSVASHTSGTSSVSHTSGRHPSNPAISPIVPSPNSPHEVRDEEGRIVSGVSNLSETDRGHLRGISETSGVSVDPPVVAGTAISPLSPPAVAEGADYLSARSTGEGTFGDASGSGSGSGSPGTKRRSNFSEELDERKK